MKGKEARTRGANPTSRTFLCILPDFETLSQVLPFVPSTRPCTYFLVRTNQKTKQNKQTTTRTHTLISMRRNSNTSLVQPLYPGRQDFLVQRYLCTRSATGSASGTRLRPPTDLGLCPAIGATPALCEPELGMTLLSSFVYS
jgi:hypothetical protein